MWNITMRKTWLSGCLFVLAIVLQVNGKTISVDDDNPADFNNIQAAINYSDNGDTILVADGTYRGNGNRDIDFKGKAITVRSENGPANCIIDCQGSDSEQHMGFYFHGAEGPDSVLDGFTITGGYHEQAGAILCTYVHIKDPRPSNPTIINCVITNNRGTYAGAIRCNSHCEPVISNCVISDNTGGYTGGISYADESRPVLSNCIIRGNSGQSGGGVRTGGGHCYGKISNCLISGNSSTQAGAAVCWWSGGGSVEVTNCTIVDNDDQLWTGGICIGGGTGTTGTITNCIIRGNTDQGRPLAQIYLWPDTNPPTTAEVTCCNVEGGWPGLGNIDADPLFVDADGADNVMATDDDDMHLLGGSPCLDAGDNSAVPPSMTIDLDGNPRIVNGTVDIGAYEGPNQGLVVIPRSVTIPEGATATFTVALAMDPLGGVEVAVVVASGDPDITVQSGAALTFDSSNYAEPQMVTLAAAEDDDYYEFKNAALVTVSAPGFSTVTVDAGESENDHILYVDDDAQGSATGTSWANALALLQDALAAAAAGPHINEIRVAQGVYKPDQGAAQTPGDREASFELVNGVAVKGGYAGVGEPHPNDRDITEYETILSGDLNGDDAVVADPCGLLVEPTRTENSYHVLLWEGAGPPDFNFKENTGLDGFTVTGGNANEGGFGDQSVGGGIAAYGWGNPTVSNCRIIGNTAEWGGGIYGGSCKLVDCFITRNVASVGGAMGSCPVLVKGCTIGGNFAEHSGGGVYMWGGDGRFEACTFSKNRAEDGGGVFLADAEPVFAACTFSGNCALVGGAVCADHFDNSAQPVFIGCAFIGNKGDLGGGMYSYASCPRLTNCIFSGNSAEEGGGMASYDRSEAALSNCTFVGNSASNGKALACNSYYPELLDPSNVQLTNCIVWNGGDEIFNADESRIAVSYSDITGGWEGLANIDADPCFADSDSDDYHLRSQAGRYDRNSQSWVQDDVTSVCVDAGDPMSPIMREPFPNGGTINMGAYGGTAEASKSYFGEPVCETIEAGDINGDCRVDFLDFRLMALHWLDDNNP
jgi:hypothetical protein